MRVTHPIEATFVEIQVRGKEKASFMEEIVEGNDRRWEKRKHAKEIFNFHAPCFTFTVPVLQPGDYCIPFSFSLPHGLPSSLFYKNASHTHKPKAKVKYHIRAIVHGQHDKQLMKFKQVLILREVPPNAEASIKQTSEHQITTWCCMDQGRSKIEVTFDRNTFLPNEVCTADIHIDNTNCNIAMNHVRLAVEQELEIETGIHRYRNTFTLTNKEEHGVGAHENGDRKLELNLATIRYECS